jgi:5'-3' exonuclease
MGIPYYFYVISRKTPGILLSECPKGCAQYFLDYNGVIHQAVNGVLHGPNAPSPSESPDELEQRMFQAIWEYTESCIQIVQPTQEVSLCVDGVAPVAKMIQQRKRRYLSGLRARLDGETVLWDRNAISPGTPFMTRLHAFLRAALRNRPAATAASASASASASAAAYVSLSTSEEPGEGEHKIFQKIRGLAASTAPIIIHGLDADLIMLSLLSHTPHIYLMREPTQAGDRENAENGPAFYYLSVDGLRRALLTDLAHTFRWNVPAAALTDSFSPEARNVIENYVAICFLLGNDFLPHPCTLSLKSGGHDRLLHAARAATEATGMTLIAPSGGAIVLDYLSCVFRELAREEESTLTEYTLKYLKRTPRAPAASGPLAPSDFYPLRPEHKDPYADILVNGTGASAASVPWNALYYKHLFHTRLHDTKTMTQACQRFVQGIEWTLRYYKKQSKDPFWYYPYGFAPTFRDLANYAAAATATGDHASDASASASASIPANVAHDGFVDPLLQLLCIMPPESAPILPQKVRLLMTVPTYGCTHMYPTEYPIQTFLKTHLWECHPVLPTLDLATLHRALQSFGNTPVRSGGGGGVSGTGAGTSISASAAIARPKTAFSGFAASGRASVGSSGGRGASAARGRGRGRGRGD